MLPLSKAVLAVIGLFYAVAYWNAFFNALLYIQTTDKWPMALVLRTYVVNQTTIGGDQVGRPRSLPPQLSLQMAILVLAIVPILIALPLPAEALRQGRHDRRRQGLTPIGLSTSTDDITTDVTGRDRGESRCPPTPSAAASCWREQAVPPLLHRHRQPRGCGNGSDAERTRPRATPRWRCRPTSRYTGVKPDLPGTEQGVDPAFRNFPKDDRSRWRRSRVTAAP